MIPIPIETTPSTSSTATAIPKKNRTKKRQQHFDKIVLSTKSLISNVLFIGLALLLIGTLCMSLLLGIILLYHFDELDQIHPKELLVSNAKHMKQFLQELRHHRMNNHNDNSSSIGDIYHNSGNDPYHDVNNNGSTGNELYDRKLQMPSTWMIPYEIPFTPIANGKQLAQDLCSGKNPTISGIAHLMQTFLQHLRQSNQLLGDVSNDKTGEDMVRRAYFTLTEKYLVPCLDIPYRNRTIFPVRHDEHSIYISLAAYREHLLYDTLKGAFGNAKYPYKIYVGIVMQNCFGIDDQTNITYKCYTGVQVVGQDPNSGRPITKVSETTPDINGVLQFCSDSNYRTYCLNGQIRLLSVHESEALGPAAARYLASKLWGGETYYIQVDSHLEFTKEWDERYINELQITTNYPKSVLSMYPPGFGHVAGETPGTRLCSCEFSRSDVEDHIIRINNGASYAANKVYEKPTQIPFIAAGFFMARAEFLQDVPFDPYLPWCFMGEEIALSMRAWTSGWNIYAPRKNWIAHQYRPGRMGLPKFWETVGRVFHRGIGFSNRLQAQVVRRIKYIVGYPEITVESLQNEDISDVLKDAEYYGLGAIRSRDDYLQLTQINFYTKQCHPMRWCNNGELD